MLRTRVPGFCVGFCAPIGKRGKDGVQSAESNALTLDRIPIHSSVSRDDPISYCELHGFRSNSILLESKIRAKRKESI